MHPFRLIFATLLLLCLAGLIRASEYPPNQSVGLHYNVGAGFWPSADTDASFGAMFTLSAGSGVQIVEPPNTNKNDLPNLIKMCPGTLQLTATPQAVFNVSYFKADSPYPLPPALCPDGVTPQSTNPPTVCPPMAWNSMPGRQPIQWDGGQKITCTIGGAGTLLQCMAASGFTNPGTAEYTLVRTPAQVSVRYAPLLGAPPVYPNEWAQGGVVCNGTFLVNGQRTIIQDNPSNLNFNFNAVGNYTLPALMSVDACDPVVHKWKDEVNPNNNYKYYYPSNNGAQVPVSTKAVNFTIQVVNPTTCSGIVSSVSPAVLAINPGQSASVQVTVRNPQVDTSIRAVGVSTPAAGWAASMAAQPPPNNFNTNIAPGLSKVLNVTLSAPAAGPLTSPIPIVITFQSSTPFCNNQNCTNQTQVNITITPSQSYNCSISTNKSALTPPNFLQPGEDLLMTTSCTNATGGAVSCPALTWSQIKTATTCVNVSLDNFTNYQAGGKATPYKNPALTAPVTLPTLPQAVLETYNGKAPFPLATTPAQTCDVAANGSINSTPFNCSLSSTANGSAVVTTPAQCECRAYTNSTSNPLNILLPGQALSVDANCWCANSAGVMQQTNCPQLTWRHTFTNASLEDAATAWPRGTPKAAPPYANPITTPPQLASAAVLWTYNGQPPNAGANTPAPQTGDVIITGTLNNVSLLCNASGGTNPIVVPPVSNCGCSLSTNTTTSPSNQLVPGQDLAISASCSCTSNISSVIVPCPALNWRHTFTNASIESKAFYTNLQGFGLKTNPYKGTVNTIAGDANAVLETYNGTPNFAPFDSMFTPVPQSGDVFATGLYNGSTMSCNVSGSYNSTNITVNPPACDPTKGIDVSLSSSATPSYAGQNITMSATCFDNVLRAATCPTFTWSAAGGTLFKASTASAASPVTNNYTITNPHQPGGNWVAVTWSDPLTNVTCPMNYSFNSTLPDLICRIGLSPSSPAKDQNSVITLFTYNIGGSETVNTTTSELISPVGTTPQLVNGGFKPSDVDFFTQTFQCTDATQGFHDVFGIVDMGKSEVESNETNNNCTATINCGHVLACPDYV